MTADLTGRVCLQGGGEFSPGCAAMDAAWLAGADGPVVVTTLAGRIGDDYATGTARGVRHLAALTHLPVTGAPDAREDDEAASGAFAGARVLVLPGGSPSGLLDALRTTSAGDAVRRVLAGGGTVVGSSAGAMVLCARTVLPDAPGGPRVADGLGLVPATIVVPHWSGPERWASLLAAAGDVGVLGLPEESGALLTVGRGPGQERGTVRALGRHASVLLDTAGVERQRWEPGTEERAWW